MSSKTRQKITTKSGTCHKCGKADSHTKLICQRCKLNWHATTNLLCITKPRGNEIYSGTWMCDDCKLSVRAIQDKNQNEIGTIVITDDPVVASTSGKGQNHGHNPELPRNVEQLIPSIDVLPSTTGVVTRRAARRFQENQITAARTSRSLNNENIKSSKPPRSRHSMFSNVSSNSARQRDALQAIQEEVKIREQRRQAEEEADQRRIAHLKEKEADARKLRAAKEALTSSNYGGDSSSTCESEFTSDDHRKITKSWVDVQNRNKRYSKQQPSHQRAIQHHQPTQRQAAMSATQPINAVLSKPWLNPRATEQEFLEATMVGTSLINISKAQRDARHLGAKDLPNFSGDPLHWAQFMSTYINTTKLCGYTDDENISRLNKCLHGAALDAVRTDLYDACTLPSALTTLKMLFGRPDVIFKAAVEQVRAAPAVKSERLDTLINLSAKVKSLCDTVRHAGMINYLNNPMLLNETIDKLPSSMKMDWARYCRLLETEEETTLDTLNSWLRENAELACMVSSNHVPVSTKGKEKEKFHAAHGRESPTNNADGTNFCHRCQLSGHRIQDCRKFKSSDIRKKWNVVNRRRLCKCCLDKHLLKNCTVQKPCGEDNCEALHNPLLHSTKQSSKQMVSESAVPAEVQPSTNSEGASKSAQTTSVLVHQPVHGKIYYQIVPITLHGKNGKSIETFAFLDAGSVVTLIDEKIANQIELDGEPTELTLKWTANIVRREKNSRRVSLQISGTNSEQIFQLHNVRTTEALNLPMQSFLSADLKYLPHLKGLPLAQYVNKQPTILIGLDNYQLMAPQRAIEGKWEDPVAIETRIGWTVLGTVNPSTIDKCTPVNVHTTEDDLHDLVKGFFNLESLGVRVPENSLESLENSRARMLLEKTVRKLPEGRYEAGLLWSTDNIKLPQSKAMALNRLKAFERKLSRSPEIKITVHQQFEDYIQKGYLVKMTPEESSMQTDKSWYLPIFVVSNPNKPNKTRLVWDAAAISNGTSNKTHIPEHWFSGPAFLTTPIATWPIESKYQQDQPDDELEVRCHVITRPKWDDLTPDLNNFSKYSKLVRTQAYILRYFYRRDKKGDLTKPELLAAEIYIIRTVQQSAFSEEFKSLQAQNQISKTSKIRQYSPHLDSETIMRMNSRLRKADYLSFDQKFPIVLPRNHVFTNLLISDFHHKFYHRNDGTVLNELQQRYVIPHLRSQLKSVKAKCSQCRIDRLKPETPEMAALPISRLAVGLKPFTHTGTDYFGPMMTKVGRRYEKRWGVIFTCLTTRAVHLEVAKSLSADSFLLVLRCFMGRRGLPRRIYCDNGTNYHGAESELQKQLIENIKSQANTEFARVEWSFNPPAAPHMGGAWERLIRSVKIGLRKALPERLPSDEMLRTCLIDIEAIINSRPLTYVSSDADQLEALTPHHFLLGCSSGIKPWGKFTDDTNYLRSEWKQQQYISQIFWQRWTLEYLPEISHRTKWYDKVKPLEIGDVVAVVENNIPNSWQLGRISEVTRSSDGNVRQATVHTSSGYLKRPGCKLAVLIPQNEISASNSSLLSGGSVTNNQ